MQFGACWGLFDSLSLLSEIMRSYPSSLKVLVPAVGAGALVTFKVCFDQLARNCTNIITAGSI